MEAFGRPIPAYPVAIACPILLAVAMTPLRATAVASGLAVVLVLPVVAAAVLGGEGPGAAAALTGALAFDVFLTSPFLSVRINGADDVFVTLVLLVVGLVVSRLVVDKRRSEHVAAQREDDLHSLRRVAGLGAGSDDLGWLIRSACQELSDLLEAPDVEYRPGPAPADMTRLAHGKVIVPAGGSGGGVSEDRGEASGCTVVLPVDRAGRHLAHLVVHYPTSGVFGVPLRQRAQAVAVADLLGAAIDKAPRISCN